MGSISTTHWSGRNFDKNSLRQQIWSALHDQKLTKRVPFGHIPNFIGAEQAAERLRELAVWQQARVVKCNPDSPQTTVRFNALEEGKILYMAVPKLSRKKCFVELTATALEEKGVPLKKAATMRGALIYGKLIRFAEMQPVDLVVVGCVAASPNGGRTGKGAGFADLELVMLAEHNLIQPHTTIVTTVHEVQVVDDEALPLELHDWPLDWVITPEATVETRTQYPRPTGLDWGNIQPDQLQSIPILRELKPEDE
jgi:5-formyltetrahydrofolate cyclo-ligase